MASPPKVRERNPASCGRPGRRGYGRQSGLLIRSRRYRGCQMPRRLGTPRGRVKAAIPCRGIGTTPYPQLAPPLSVEGSGTRQRPSDLCTEFRRGNFARAQVGSSCGHGGLPEYTKGQGFPQPSSVTVSVTFFVTVSPETRHTPCNPMQPSLCTISLRNRRNRGAGGRILDLQVLVELVLKTGVLATGPWVRIPPPPPFDAR